MRTRRDCLAAMTLAACVSTGCRQPGPASVEGRGIRIEFNHSMHSRVIAKFGGPEIPLGDFTSSEFLSVQGGEMKDFRITEQRSEPVQDSIGRGHKTVIRGSAPPLEKTVAATVYEAFPHMAVFEVEYRNTGQADISVTGWTNHAYSVSVQEGTPEPAFWSYQSGSYKTRPDWVLPLKTGFEQENFQGMNAADYGGGTPVVDVWRRDAGIGVGLLETVPKLVSLPVAMPGPDRATLAVKFQTEQALRPGAVLKTFRTFVAVHQGDYFRTLATYRRLMMSQGVRFPPAPEHAYAPIWCAWGYGRRFTTKQVYGALPVVKRLGFGWVTVDDGWQTAEGDWFLDPQKFPNQDRDMKALVDTIHAEGFKAQLWWAPLAADPGTELLSKHPERLLLNADGSKQKISWWDSWYLCPGDPDVVQYHRELVEKIIGQWGYDGLKLDGQHMNGVPPCYNPAHRHARPEEAVEALPRFLQAIFDTARKLKPDVLVEFCPCGTSYSFFTLPFMNMSVASDPTSSWQIRSKGKTLKALAGDLMAYFGDHVELSDGGNDFASTVGVGGVVGTNFTWPPGSAARTRLDLTPERERHWAKWIGIYTDKMLSRGQYVGALYDIGFDRPEAHAIRKGANMYYAFYAPQFEGPVELRGLDRRSYRVTDYENSRDLGTVTGPTGRIEVQFAQHLLLEARPQQ